MSQFYSTKKVLRMKKIIQFILLIVFMILLNLIGHLIGTLFIERYKYYWSDFYFFETLRFIGIFSFFQIFIFPINKKGCVYIIPIFTLLLFSLLVLSVEGFELADICISLTSKIIVLLASIVDNITNNTIRGYSLRLLYSLGYSIYLFVVFSSFKYIMQYLGSKYSLFAMNNKVNSKDSNIQQNSKV